MLRDRGWTVHPQVGCSGYRIDIGVVDPRAPGRYLVGIECDGRSYHSGATARDRDRLRQHVLEGLGWRIYRIWSTDWWINPEGEIETISTLLHGLLEVQEDSQAIVACGTDTTGGNADESEFESESDARLEDSPTPQTHDSTDRIQSLRTFEEAIVPSLGVPDKFYEPNSAPLLREHLRLAIDAEGPVLEAVLFRRMARAWGLGRTGRRIVERLHRLMPNDIRRTKDDSGTFYWPQGCEPATWTDCRVADATDASRRHIDEVCIEEISLLLLHILRYAGASPRGDAARSVCRLLGMARTTEESEARVGSAIERLLAMEAITEVNGAVRLPI